MFDLKNLFSGLKKTQSNENNLDLSFVGNQIILSPGSKNKYPSFSIFTFEFTFSVVDKKFKGLIDLVVDILRLHLLGDKVGDDGVDPEVQLLHSLLPVLTAALSALQALQQDFDLKQRFFIKVQNGR